MRILLADDDAPIRDLLEAVLSAHGHEVETSASGDEAWAAYQRLAAPLVFLDWEMPGLNGLEVCRRIREHPGGDRAYILMVTARSRTSDLDAVLDAGADDYLGKPVTPDDVAARLRIAERRMLIAEQRRLAEEQLQKAKYMAGIGELSLALQHEINNPLAALLTTTALITGGMLEEHEIPESLKTIEEQAQRIADVLKRLRDAKQHRSVEYAHGQRMVDLGGKGKETIG